MSPNLRILACLGAALTVTGAAQATIIGSGDGFAIPDGDPEGLSSSFAVIDDLTIDDLTVNLTGLAHTWSGDLQMTLTHDDGLGDVLSVMFLNRPGSTTVDNGQSPFGSSIQYNGDYSFNDAGSDLLTALNSSTVELPSGTYSHQAVLTGTELLSSFAGRSTAGTWTLTVADNADFDTGSFNGWSVDVVPVPAPAALALLGLAGITSRRRRQA